MSWINTTGWQYTTLPNRIFRTSTVKETGLIYRSSSDKTFLGNKNYLFKTKINNLNNLELGSGVFKINSDWGLNIEIFYNYLAKYQNNLDSDGYLYFYSKPNSNFTTRDLVKYNTTNSFTSSYGILNTEIFELDWTLNGYSWVGNDSFVSLPVANPLGGSGIHSRCNGWSYDDSSNSYYWFDTEGTLLSATGSPIEICPPYPPLTNPSGINGQIQGTETSGCGYFISPFKEINHMSRFVDYQFFNFQFYLEKYTFSRNDANAGINIYLSDIEPYTGILENEFNNYLDNCELLISTNTTGTYSFYGLSGNRYLFIVGDAASATYSANTQLSLSNIEVTGGYHPSNNQVYGVNISNNEISFNPSDFIGATYSAFSGSGNSVDDNVIGVTLSSKIGNGSFKSGIWENGVWNNGWRKDQDIRELYDVIRSIKILADRKWRIRISGLTTDISDLKIGEYISIGNIVAIDINDNRNILKDYYRIINKGEIDNRLSFIEVDIEVRFPMRRIEKDSEFHRIKVTRNIWAYGVFLNGYFEGIWNNGLFKGYPLITEMDNTNWIDGIYDGGHFESNYYISGSFSQTFRDTSSLPAKLGLSFSTPHNVKVGDNIEIIMPDNINKNRYDGESKVIKIVDDYQFVTNKNYGLFVNNESGSFTTRLTTGLIQNMKFNSNNVSSITSVDSMVSSSVFVYNSWIDVVYDNDSAVNIGKPQNILDSISRKTYSENNLYGYPTNDVLSSISKFRDSYSLSERNYSLGNKYRIYEDYVGDSSKFTEYFGPTGPDSELLIKQGWTYSKQDVDTIAFSRADNIGETSILGEELKVDSTFKGGVLDISTAEVPVNRSKIELTKNKYSVVEFDLVKSKIDFSVNSQFGVISDAFYNLVPNPGSKISASYSEPDSIYQNFGLSASLEEVDTGSFKIRKEPLLHFNNLNVIKREFIEGTQSVSNIYELEATYLPIYENVNHVATKKTKKVEYFYNKRNLSMNFRGNGFFGELPSGYIINNLKLYEVNMIPFFQYFSDLNINKSVQIPLQGISPYIFFKKKNFNIVNKSGIGFSSFNIFENDIFTAVPTISSDSGPTPAMPEDFIQAYLNRVIADGGENLLSKAEIEALLPPDWENASFLNVPSSRKAGTLYSIIGSDLDVTRSSNAWEIDSDSDVSILSANLPAINFANGSFQGYAGYGELSGLSPYSNDITQANLKVAVTTPNASTILETSATDVHTLSIDSSAISVGDSVTYVIVVESIGGRNVRLRDANASNTANSIIDLSTGDILVSPTSGTVSVEYLGLNRYLIVLTFDRVNSNLSRMQIGSANGTTFNFLGDITKGLKVYNAFICETDYYQGQIVTGNTSFTRLKTWVTKTGMGAQIGQVNSTILLKFNASNFGTLRTALTLDGTGGSLKFQKLGNNDIQISLVDGATTIFSIVLTGSLEGDQRIAISYKSDQYLVSRNGSTITGGSITETLPTMTRLTLGSDSNDTSHWDDTIKLVSLWKGFKNQTTLNEMTT